MSLDKGKSSSVGEAGEFVALDSVDEGHLECKVCREERLGLSGIDNFASGWCRVDDIERLRGDGTTV